MHSLTKKFIVISLAACTILGLPNMSHAQETAKPADTQAIREMAEQVDILQTIADLRMTEEQIALALSKVTALRQSRDEFKKKEDAIYDAMKDTIQQIRDALVAGKPVPDAADQAAKSRVKELQSLRQQGINEFQSAVKACVQQLSGGQTLKIAHSPELMKRATHIVQHIRGTSEDDLPGLLIIYSDEIVDAKKVDKSIEWQAQIDKVYALRGVQREQALEEFNKQKDAEIAQMRDDAVQLLTTIRSANSMVIELGVNKVANAIRPKIDIQNQLFGMIGRILDNPLAEPTLKARLEKMKTPPAK